MYSAGLQAAQLHGRETPDERQVGAPEGPHGHQGVPGGRSPGGAGAGDFGADAILLDAPNPGSGRVFDWALAGDLPGGQRLLIAGGLNADNVAAAVAQDEAMGCGRHFGC